MAMTQVGIIIETLPNLTFKIQCENGKEVRAYMSGKMKKNKISCIVGDKVEMVIDEYGPNNRIVKRLKHS